MKTKLLYGGMFLLMMSLPTVGLTAAGSARLPGVTEAMLQADFWIARTSSPQQVMLTPKEIGSFNRSISAVMPQVVVDLNAFPASLDKFTLQQWLTAQKLPRAKERYAKRIAVTGAQYDQVEQNLNLTGVKATNPVVWGFTVRRTDLRTFPTDLPSSEADEDDDFDLFQETAVNIAEPVAVLHSSSDGNWVYVQLYNYRGWIRMSDVALAVSRMEWQARRDMGSFLVITGTRVVPRESAMGKPIADWRAGMGTRLPLRGRENDGYVVEIPQRDAKGGVVWRKAWIHGKADVSAGYLPYTRAHILRQAFKMLGGNYGWGGLQEGRDCSSFIMDIFAVFGIRTPRNADQQERVPGRQLPLNGASDAATRYAQLARRAEPGATLHMRNHVMLYLGQDAGKHYAIHSLGSYGDATRPLGDGTLPRVEVMKVVVSELDLTLRSGRRFIEVLSSANVWHP